MSEVLRTNLERLLAAAGLSLRAAARQTGLDERTLRGILHDRKRPHPQTLHRLAEGLGVSVDELMLEPIAARYRCFDRQTNPAVEAALQEEPQLFVGWTEAEFDELSSHFGAGGALTPAGVRRVAQHLNRKRLLHRKLDLLLESTHAEIVGRILDAMHDEVAICGDDGAESAPVRAKE
ncbi:MAG: helix-turn-helix domain-containing protein [Planctomycetota bacterium]